MRLNAASLLVALSTLPFVLRDGNAQEFEKPVRQKTVQTHNEDTLIRARGGLSALKRTRTPIEPFVSEEIRREFDSSFKNKDVIYLITELDAKNITTIKDPVEKAKLYNEIAIKFPVGYAVDEIVALFTGFQSSEIIGDEKDLVKIAEKINEFCELVNKDLQVKIPPFVLIRTFSALKTHNILPPNSTSKEVSEVIRYFNEKVSVYNKNEFPEALDSLFYTYYISEINGYKEKADAMGRIHEVFNSYAKNPVIMQTLLNGLAWEEYIPEINKKSPEEVAKAILEKVVPFNFSGSLAVMLARNGVDPKYANEYLEETKKKVPFDLPACQLVLFNVPLKFYMEHESHDPSVVIHDFNQSKIKDLLKASGVEDLDSAMKEIKALYPHLGMALPEDYAKSYQIIKSISSESGEECKLDNLVLVLLPGYKPGNDSSTRVDAAFMFSAFATKDLRKQGFNVILSAYEKDYDVERIANEISGNYNCKPGVEYPFKAIIIAGHGIGDGLYTDDVPYDPGFSEEKHESSVFNIKDKGIFQNLTPCFMTDTSSALILWSCSAATPNKPQNFMTFAAGELPENIYIQGPEVETIIYGAGRPKDGLPTFIFDGSKTIRGNKIASK